MRNRPRKQGAVRLLDPADPRNPNHPCHDDQWLELARAIGRAMGRQQFAEDNQGKSDEDRSTIRKVLK